MMEQSYVVEIQSSRQKNIWKLYTAPIPLVEKEEVIEKLGRYCESEYWFDQENRMSGLRSIPLDAFFSRHPSSNEVRRALIPSEELHEPYNAQAQASLEQALYLYLVGDSIAMPVCIFKIVGEDAINNLLVERNASPHDLSPLLEKCYIVLTDYSYQRSKSPIIVGLRTK